MLCYIPGQLATGIVAASQKLMSWEKRAVWSLSPRKQTNKPTKNNKGKKKTHKNKGRERAWVAAGPSKRKRSAAGSGRRAAQLRITCGRRGGLRAQGWDGKADARARMQRTKANAESSPGDNVLHLWHADAPESLSCGHHPTPSSVKHPASLLCKGCCTTTGSEHASPCPYVILGEELHDNYLGTVRSRAMS